MKIQKYFTSSEGMIYRRKNDKTIVGKSIYLGKLIDGSDDNIDNYEEVVDQEYSKLKEDRENMNNKMKYERELIIKEMKEKIEKMKLEKNENLEKQISEIKKKYMK